MEHHQSPLLTDLYQLTMLQSYLDEELTEAAAFEFFVRKLPATRNFLVAAGLEQLLEFLSDARFSEDELDYLKTCGRFKSNLIDYLSEFRFTGDVDAMPEGTVFFADEPVVRVTAPLPQAQLIETRLINLLQLQIMLTSKAVRCKIAAPNKTLVDFGLRRAHGAEAGMMAARDSYISGFAGTSNVLAGKQFAIPIMGTMAHSYIQTHDSEVEAFRHFAISQPDNVVLLIDTYNTARGALRVAALAPVLAEQGINIKAVRIDSGELGAEATAVRTVLDQAQQSDIGIFASSSIDEYLIQALERNNAPIDGYGIGTSLTTSEDAPYLNCAYKLQEYGGVPRRKRSSGKATWPGRKQVVRYFHPNGEYHYDQLCNVNEQPAAGTPLLCNVMHCGQRTQPQPTLLAIRQHLEQSISHLPDALRQLDQPHPYRVVVSDRLVQMAEEVDRQFGG